MAHAASAPKGQKRCRVVVVEPDADNRDMYLQFLGFDGFEVVPCDHPDDVAASVSTADAIVCALRLPRPFGCDGIELVRQLRRVAAGQMPVVMLTTSDSVSDHDRARQAGCAAFVVKPCLPDRLAATLHRVLGEAAGERRHGESTRRLRRRLRALETLWNRKRRRPPPP